MSEVCGIRLSSDEKAKLQKYVKELGYQSQSDLLRELIRRGYESFELSQKEEHLLFNSAQCVFLLRELVNLLAANEERSAQIISHVRESAVEWTNKFKTVYQA